MQLLLILSALLSALTGAIGARVPELRSHQTVCACTAQQVAPAQTGIARPVQALSLFADMALAPQAAALVVALATPLYASRRRE